jgi:hypothetical protein
MTLTDFFPERYLAHRPNFPKLYAQFRAADFDNYAEPTWELRDELRRPYPAWQQSVTIPRLEEELEATKSLVLFQRAGRNIFALSPALRDMLNHTAVGDLRWDDLHLPYPSLYLHFGTGSEIELPLEHFEHKHGLEDGELGSPEVAYWDLAYYLDGAFVHRGTGQALDITLVFRNPRETFVSKVSVPADYRFPTISFSLDIGNSKAPVRTFDDAVVVFSDIWDASSQVGELGYGVMRRLLEKPKEFEFASERDQYILLDQAILLIVNSLCYLNLTEKPDRAGLTNPQAEALQEQIRQAKNKQRRQPLQEKLARLSYSTIRYFGDNLTSPGPAAGGEVAAHWRRGHWRRQPVGVGRSETRLLWLQPTVVRRDKGEPVQGHVYDV